MSTEILESSKRDVSRELIDLESAIKALHREDGFVPNGRIAFRIQKSIHECILTHNGNEFRGKGETRFEAYGSAYLQAMSYGV